MKHILLAAYWSEKNWAEFNCNRSYSYKKSTILLLIPIRSCSVFDMKSYAICTTQKSISSEIPYVLSLKLNFALPVKLESHEIYRIETVLYLNS